MEDGSRCLARHLQLYRSSHDPARVRPISFIPLTRTDETCSLDSLRFLTHFIGDVHQPLHLTSRERGGNSDPVIWQGRHMSLHALWDTGLITKAVREQHNYTRPLPSPQIEAGLRGTIYDPYVRLILWEGVRVWWRQDLEDWLSCPSSESTVQEGNQITFGSTGAPLVAEGVCPEYWARETHKVTCGMVFPEGYDNNAPAREVNTPAYYGPIHGSSHHTSPTHQLTIDRRHQYHREAPRAGRTPTRRDSQHHLRLLLRSRQGSHLQLGRPSRRRRTRRLLALLHCSTCILITIFLFLFLQSHDSTPRHILDSLLIFHPNFTFLLPPRRRRLPPSCETNFRTRYERGRGAVGEGVDCGCWMEGFNCLAEGVEE